MAVSPGTVRPLRSLLDNDLQKKLEHQLLRHPAWAKMIQEKKMTVGLVDLADPEIRNLADMAQ